MNILITILLVIVALVALLLITALFVNKNYAVQRETIISKPVAEVFSYIRLQKNQDHYNVWVMKDPAMKKSYRGTDGTAGFVYVWDGNKQAGKGEQELKKIRENERLDIEIRFEKPFAAVAQIQFITESLPGGQTKVTWGMQSAMNYPMNIMLLFLNFNKLLGADMEKSFENLKQILEKK